MEDVVIHRQHNKHIAVKQPSHAILVQLGFNAGHIFRRDWIPPL